VVVKLGLKPLRMLLAILLLGAAVPACTATVGLEPLSNGACAEGLKACDGMCVGTDDRRFGCASPSCTPCFLDNTTEICGPTGECEIAVCDLGFDDCDTVRDNGCETDLDHDVDHCGHCRAACDLDNAEPLCTSGRCTIRACDADWDDCDGRPDTGCETDLRLPAHCGDCDTICTASQTCIGGSCMP
jgi:hypothetical protein